MLIGAGTLRLVHRGLWRHRRVNATIAVTLAVLGGVLLAIGSLAWNLLVSPWTYDSDRLGVLHHGIAGAAQQGYGFAADEYRALADASLFDALTASASENIAYGDGSGAARPLRLVRTLPETLAVSDGAPLLGRFVEHGERAGDRNVVIAWQLWQDAFDGRADVLGQSLMLAGEPHTVVGVMPPRFHFNGGDLWMAHASDPRTDTATDARFVLNFKLRAGDTMADVAPRIAAIAAAFPRAGDAVRYPDGWRITPSRVIDAVIGPQRPATLLVLAGALSLFVLGLINVAALLVARQLADAPLVATRLALGESRAAAVVTVFIESFVLAAIAVVLAIGIARLAFDGLVGMVALEWVPRELDGNFTFSTPALWSLPLAAIAIAAVLTVARLPGVLRADARACIENGTRTGTARGERRTLAILSGVQIALATAVTIATLAIGAGADALASRPLGFDPAHVAHARLVFPADRYTSHAVRAATFDRLSARLRDDGIATHVGLIDSAPMQRYSRSGTVQDWDGPPLDAPLLIEYRAVHGDVAGALGLAMLEGRFIEPSRDDVDAEPVAVVSRSLAERLAPRRSAIGASITVASVAPTPVRRRIVGVVEDVLQDSPLSTARPTVYVPYVQEVAPAATAAGGQMSLVARHRAGTTWNSAAFAAALGTVDPWIARHEEASMSARAERTISGVALARRLFATFALFGVLLATLGIAAVTALSVGQRQHELAVRGAVGAAPRGLLMMILRGSVRTTMIAALVGTALAALLITPVMGALQGAAQLRAIDFLAAPALLVACAIVATLLPARLATRVQPMVLLRRRA